MENLTKIGSFMALAGIISAGLSFVGYELRILMWIDMWGVGVGWAIRIALILVGGALYLSPMFLGAAGSDAPANE
ncbi:MAG: hypothetical protein AAFQ82_25325 [Myxococcota bacterium]